MQNSLVRSLALLLFVTPFMAFISLSNDSNYHLGAENLKLFAGVVGILLILLYWLFKSYQNKTLVVKKNTLYIPIILFIAWNFVSLFWVANNQPAFVTLSQFISIALLFFLIVNATSGSKDAVYLLKIIIFSLLGVSVIGLLQYYFDDVVLIRDFFWQSGKPSATFGNKNMASHFVVMTLPISVCLFLYAKSAKHITLYAIIFTIGAWFLMYASARQAYLSSIIQLILIFCFVLFDYIKNRRKSVLSLLTFRRLKVVVSIISIVFLFLVSNFTDQGWVFSKEQNTSKVERITNIVDTENERIPGWVNTIEMIKDHPIIGVGSGQWLEIYPQYIDKSMNDRFIADYSSAKRLHNDFLQMFANVGLIGFIFLLWIFLVSTKNILNILMDSGNEGRLLVLGIALGLTGFLVVSMVSFPIEVYFPAFLVFLYLALIYSFKPANELYKVDFKHRVYAPILLVFFGVLAIAIVNKSIDWLRADGLYISSTINESNGDFDLALQDSYEAFLLNQSNSLYSLSVGRNLLKKNQVAESVKFLKIGWELSPLNKSAMLDLSMAYKKLNKIKLEENVLVQFLKHYPNDVNALARISRVLFANNNKNEAFDAYAKMKLNFDRIEGRSGFYPFHKEVAEVANIFKDYQYISYVYEKIISHSNYSDNANDYAVLATIEYFRLGNKDKGIKLYNKARDIDKNVKLPKAIIDILE